MDKNVSIVLSREESQYRKVAQKHWNLTDEQMKGMHVHHEPPKALGGRDIPEHLYVCSPDIHLYGWHKGEGSVFPKMAGEGGRLSAIVRRKKARERETLSLEEQLERKEERKRKRKEKEDKARKRVEYNLRVEKALREYEERKAEGEKKIQELNKLQKELIELGLILPDP